MDTILPKLYKQKSKKMMQWWISYNNNSYTVYHGYVNSKIQQTTTIIQNGKNSGKSNETSIIEQTEKEALALWNKMQERKGYSKDIDAEKPIFPMLAHSWDDHKHKMKYPLMIQGKLDGARCLAHIQNGKIRLMSRQNKEYIEIPHLNKALSFLPDMILDGELFNPKISFRSIISGLKKEGGNEYTPQIQYHIYDVVNTDPYYQRYELLQSLNLSDPLFLTPTYIVNSQAEIDDKHNMFKRLGYEGAIIRNPSGLYVCDKRSKDLLKYKKFMDREYRIVDAEENKGKLEGTCVFVCETPNGTRFNVLPEGTFEERCQYWEDWQNGDIESGDLITVEFFEYTDNISEVPRFPVGKGIRNYE